VSLRTASIATDAVRKLTASYNFVNSAWLK